MKAKSIVLVVVVAFAAPALGAYQSIFHNMWNGVGDTAYRPDLPGKALTVSELEAELTPTPITLTASEIVQGTYQTRNASCSLTTYFQSFDPTPLEGWVYGRALFTGGSFSLTFEYSTDGQNWTNHWIGGPIDGMYVGVSDYQVGAYTMFKGEGLFDANDDEYLPPPPLGGVWPDPEPGFSSIHSLSIKIGGDYTGYAFDVPMTGAETQYTLTPDESAIPEPVSLLLLSFGAIGLVRRRR